MYIRLEVMLEAEYGNRLDEMVKASGKTKREIVQDAIRFFFCLPGGTIEHGTDCYWITERYRGVMPTGLATATNPSA